MDREVRVEDLALQPGEEVLQVGGLLLLDVLAHMWHVVSLQVAQQGLAGRELTRIRVLLTPRIHRLLTLASLVDLACYDYQAVQGDPCKVATWCGAPVYLVAPELVGDDALPVVQASCQADNRVGVLGAEN